MSQGWQGRGGLRRVFPLSAAILAFDQRGRMPTLSVITPNQGINHKNHAMKALSEQTVVAYGRRMERVGVGNQDRAGYFRWVRFYLDFCQKYGHPPREEASIRSFLAKLESKHQPETRPSNWRGGGGDRPDLGSE